MMIKAPFTKSWCLGLVTFVIQINLLAMIFQGQISASKGSTIFYVPFQVTDSVRTGQFISIFISIVIAYDVLMPIKEMNILWFRKDGDEEWLKVVAKDEWLNVNAAISHPRSSNKKLISWIVRIVFPNLLKFIQGVLVLMITFIIAIKSNDIIDLFKDIAAMQVISELDNAVFRLSNDGYFGPDLKKDAKIAKRIEVRDRVQKTCIFSLPLRPLVLLSLLILMIIIFISTIVIGQVDKSFFKMKYPN